MLKLYKIKKDYVMKDLENVHALKGITVCFRRNEFVAVLGPSGCGKTTLLNIIGGLDKYSSGNLLIEGRSTKEYGDREWDTYRNHSIGFVFQTYNLISHQNILRNVELALTISGIDKKERKQRSMEALALVGLKGMEKKKPNQLSGGQMQRVAIARALVNNPEILLADEPTGALDSETSIQIMDLLKSVAQKRLVIMVTHNPDLATKYATRIITMKDGLLTGDSNFYKGEKPEEREAIFQERESTSGKVTTKGKKRRTSMSFFTAMGLSLSNLISKLNRTILVAIAGSIGIIGVSTVLAVSQGVNDYIYNMQDDMLSSYPLRISEEAVDYTSLMTSLNGWNDGEQEKPEIDVTSQVGVSSLVNYLMKMYGQLTAVKTNDINEDLMKYIENIPEENYYTINYSYGIDPTNNLFTTWTKDYLDTPEDEVISLNGLTQRYIAELKTVKGFSQYASYVDLFTDFMKELPDNKDYILSQYDLLGDSKFAENENELMLVVEKDTTLTDVLLAQLGVYKHNEFINIALQAINSEGLDKDALKEKYPYRTEVEFTDLIGKELYYFPHDSLYEYGPITSESYDTITSVVLTDDDLLYLTYNDNLNNTGFEAMTGIYVDLNQGGYQTVILYRMGNAQEGISGKELINGTWNVLSPAIVPIISQSNPELADMLAFLNLYDGDLASIVISNAAAEAPDTANVIVQKWTTSNHLFGPKSSVVGKINVNKITQEPISGYQYKASINDADMLTNPTNYGGQKMKISGILRLKDGLRFGSLNRGFYYNTQFAKRYMEDAKNSKIINDATHGFKKHVSNPVTNNRLFDAYVTFDYLDYTDGNNPVIKDDGYASSLNGDLSSSFSNLFSSLTGVDYSEQNSIYMRSLSGLKIIEIKGEDDDPSTFEFKYLPEDIMIYSINFAGKDKITSYLDDWNKSDVSINIDGREITDRHELTYTDTIGVIIGTINTLITAITIALIVFTSLSLIVSCFMIAVITIISVMERIKEIGVIRSLGGRKKDVSRLFIAENIIIGFFAGLIGIAITYGISIIINVIVTPFGVSNIANLTWYTALIMVGLSTLLTTISGLIPSRNASKQDPVVALRTE